MTTDTPWPGMPQRPIQRHPSGQLMLPGWDTQSRALPNQLAKSAVFTARRDRDLGTAITRQVIPSVGTVVEYEGPLLNQSHADVWECLVHECRERGSGLLSLRPKNMVRLVSDGRVREEACVRVLRLMRDLAKANVRITYRDGSEFGGSLISYHRHADDSYDIAIGDDVVRLFWDDHVLIDWRIRISIRGELAKWLQHYFAACLEPTLVEAVRELSSSQTRDIYRFRQAVKTALQELVRVRALTAAEVRGDYVLATVRPDARLPQLPSP